MLKYVLGVHDSFVSKGGMIIMATRLLEQYKWTKDGRKWVFYTWVPTLNGKRKNILLLPLKLKKKHSLQNVNLQLK